MDKQKASLHHEQDRKNQQIIKNNSSHSPNQNGVIVNSSQLQKQSKILTE